MLRGCFDPAQHICRDTHSCSSSVCLGPGDERFLINAAAETNTDVCACLAQGRFYILLSNCYRLNVTGLGLVQPKMVLVQPESAPFTRLGKLDLPAAAEG